MNRKKRKPYCCFNCFSLDVDRAVGSQVPVYAVLKSGKLNAAVNF